MRSSLSRRASRLPRLGLERLALQVTGTGDAFGEFLDPGGGAGMGGTHVGMGLHEVLVGVEFERSQHVGERLGSGGRAGGGVGGGRSGFVVATHHLFAVSTKAARTSSGVAAGNGEPPGPPTCSPTPPPGWSGRPAPHLRVPAAPRGSDERPPPRRPLCGGDLCRLEFGLSGLHEFVRLALAEALGDPVLDGGEFGFDPSELLGRGPNSTLGCGVSM